MTGQLDLVHLWRCTTCAGTGRLADRETGIDVRCPTCLGAGTLTYPPSDTSVIPF